MNHDDILDQIRHSIYKYDPSARAYLFGSRARGAAQAGSDWDVLVLVDENRSLTELEDKFRNDLYDLELESGNIISLFVYSKQYWNQVLCFSPLFSAVKKEGVLL